MAEAVLVAAVTVAGLVVIVGFAILLVRSHASASSVDRLV